MGFSRVMGLGGLGNTDDLDELKKERFISYDT